MLFPQPQNESNKGALPDNRYNHPSNKDLQSATLLPDINQPISDISINRHTELMTIIPSRPRQEIRLYKVMKGDSVFEIATKFNITPHSVLWANFDQLNDNPHLISVDMKLQIPPIDGVIYEWQTGDTIQAIAGEYKADPDEIINWPGNYIDLTDPQIEEGKQIMIPGGKREFKQWLIPTIPRGNAGVSPSLYGGGACTGSFEGSYGSGGFIWPTGNHTLSGNDYWDGHLGIDIAAPTGSQISAADSGVVVFAGWANFGYGNTVMIDHGNGYQSLYAHLNSISISCGRSVSQGTTIGFAGSTGNSTGSHLHFEIRYQGGFINPWYVLPAP